MFDINRIFNNGAYVIDEHAYGTIKWGSVLYLHIKDTPRHTSNAKINPFRINAGANFNPLTSFQHFL